MSLDEDEPIPGKLGEVDELVLYEKLAELNEKINVLKAEKKKLQEKKQKMRNERPEGYRAQALSTFHLERLPSVHRCPTRRESRYHFPVVVGVM